MTRVPLVPAALAMVFLAGCAPVPSEPTTARPQVELYPTLEDFFDTSWSGIDDEGVATAFEFDADGDVSVEYDGVTSHEATGSWTIGNDDVLTVIVRSEGEPGTVVYVGVTDDYRSDIPLHAVYVDSGETRSLTISLQR